MQDAIRSLVLASFILLMLSMLVVLIPIAAVNAVYDFLTMDTMI